MTLGYCLKRYPLYVDANLKHNKDIVMKLIGIKRAVYFHKRKEIALPIKWMIILI